MSTAPRSHDVRPSAGGTSLLSYRAWRGEFLSPWYAVWALARTGVVNISRRWTFWGLYGCSFLVFLTFFFGQYFMVWLGVLAATSAPRPVRPGEPDFNPGAIVTVLRDQVKLNGSAETYRNLIWYEGYIVVVVLALAGSILVGNDFRHGSLSFYLSKPIHRWHYILGKCMAVGIIVNSMTTFLALLLFVQFGTIDEWSYYWEQSHLLLGILGYGAVLTVVMSLLLVATASWLRQTVPMIMVWTAVFVFGRALGHLLSNVRSDQPNWKLIDLWNDMYVVGNWCFRIPPGEKDPSAWAAFAVLVAISLACAVYLDRRIRAVEVVR